MKHKIEKMVIIIIIAIIIIAINIPYRTLEQYKDNETYTISEPYDDNETYTVSEPYTVTETYSEKEPYDSIENIDTPYQETVSVQWNVTWYTITGSGQWGSSVGSSTFPSTFIYNWGLGTVFEGYADYIGFIATSTINVPQDRPVSFTIGGDDGIKLYVDEQLTIDDPDTHPYRKQSKVVNLNAGKHSLMLRYYEWTDYAMISFDTDKDILSWQEPKTRIEQRTIIKYRDINKERTVVKYRDINKERTVVKYRDVEKYRDVIKLKETDLSLLQRYINK